MDVPPGFRLVRFPVLDSTNEEGKRQAEAGADGGLILWADTQTAGRGRRGRTWISPEGGLYFSLLLRPTCSPSVAAQLSFVSAIALADAVRPTLTQPDLLALKWPNDVLIDGKKIAGILLESGTKTGTLDWLVVGVGLNIAAHPESADYPATSLNAHASAAIRTVEILDDIVRAFEKWYQVWSLDGFEPVRTAWLQSARGLDQPIAVRLPKETLHGVFRGLGPDGALRLELPNEGERTIPAGDVYFPATS
jgi:BirA family transcriptional regulator, biotin operon repressor / biotin---[acetyl-CoA-carboxylase] ligase